jgi:CRP/FNR family transcriptional regulator
VTVQFDFAAHPMFKAVKPEVLDYILKNSRFCQYTRGQILLSEGSLDLRFFALSKGSVRVFFNNPDGRQVVVKLFTAPACFGEMECMAGIGYLEAVETLEKSAGLEIPRHTFLLALRQSTELTFNLANDLAMRLCIAAQNERSLAFNPVERRLANMLYAHASIFGLPVPEGTMIRVPLSQDALAQSLGVARRSITRALGRWVQEGLIKKNQGRFVITDMKKLSEACDPSDLHIAYSLGARP